MKKINFLLLGILLVVGGFFAGCTKDTTNDAAISFAGDAGFTATDASVTPGGTFTVKWTATSSTNMGYFSILKDGSAYDVWSQKEIPSASKSTYIDQVTITVPLTVGTYTYAFVVYDTDKNELVRKSIVITVTASVQLVSYPGRILGDQNNAPVGSLFASSTGTVYLSSAINPTNGPTIDITYGLLGTNNVPSVISGSERIANGFTQPTAANNPSITTYIASTLDIATVTNASLAAISFTSATRTITVASGNTYAFKNASNKIGLFKVTNLNTGATTGAITIDVKVQP